VKFVLLVWWNVWVCEFDDNWIVDVEFTCSSDIEMETLWILFKLVIYDVVVVELWIDSWLCDMIVVECCC